MYSLVAKRTQLVQAVFANNVAVGNRYNFTDIPNLSRNNIIVYGFEGFTATQLSVTPDQNTVVPAGDIDNIVVTFRDINKVEFVYQLPLYSTVRSLNGGFPIMIKPRIINLTDCYVQCSAVGSITANMTVPFVLYYDIIGEQQKS